MNTTSFLGIAGIGALVAAVTAGWGYVRMVFAWLQGLVICQTIVTDEASEAVLGYCWHKGRRSPFGTKVFGGIMSWVQPKSRVQLVAFENISSDPVLYWFGKWPVIIRRRGGSDNTNAGQGSNPRNFDTVMMMFCLRGTVDLDTLVASAVEHYNHVKQGINGESKRKRFMVRRIGGANYAEKDGVNPTRAYAEAPSGRIGLSDELIERLLQKTLRLLQWRPEDLVKRDDTHEPFHGFAFPPEVYEAMSEMRLWLDNEKWFRDKAVPWRRGWLLYGPPGSGKSTLVRAMAMSFDLPVFAMDLSTMNNDSFTSAWNEVTTSAPCVALIEDIDAVFKGRENIAATNRNRDNLTFDCLLNSISGVGNAEGVFLVVTTNHPETLDPALGVVKDGRSSRPGRIDRVIELTYIAERERMKLASHILSDFPDLIPPLVAMGEGMTPAQFQDLCAQEALRQFWHRHTTT